MPVTYPNETAAYRSARDELLQQEIALRNQAERVAGLRRKLPEGGSLKEDFLFTTSVGEKKKLSALFSEGKDVLAVYSLMFKPEDKSPCPMCTSLLDGLTGQASHFGQKIDFVVVASASPEQLMNLGKERGWDNLNLLSAKGTGYQSAYHGETADGAQLPMMNIFTKTPSGITHFWGSESFFADTDGQPRHIDQLWPLWNMLDLTPGGRGTDWYPGLSY